MNNTEFKIYGWARILLFILPYLFIRGMLELTGYVIAGISFEDQNFVRSPGQQLTVLFFGLLGTFLVLWIFMKYVDREKFIDLGFQLKNRSVDFIVGTAVGLITMVFGYILLIGIDEINYSEFNFNPEDLLISVLLFLIVALVEEALFRGYVLKNLMLSCNKYFALIISSALFSLMHGFNPNMSLFSFFGLFCAGIILGITYVYTKNLWYPIGLHFGWNFFQTHLGFNVSGQDFYSLIEFNYTTGNLFNGGEFGFEGSVFSVIAQLFIFLGALYYYKRPVKNILTG
ncbi:CPBP family intramembrane glutamic endopeptidase [Salinimicrobium sp. TH3]|uniref:CPBP family intramembrane glutamic endopeptidase n=1 Tax=Salinimicrobium sp. TH3 TaxID=2997342 RepID=UPI002276F171|nr:type II CAAX endopeptidase family protein [Salinimicrobium sp. TH3]MCY2686562.1 type II CAAX endopeptidase family protein [Salinimicrobium sp. TH3]